ncbi:hypothetical protein Ancab_034645 [Ancistrocladus abbreviatus]
MGSPGFRPPQFSDDVAWLPAWLQPHVRTMHLDDLVQDHQLPSEQSLKDMASLKTNDGEDEDPDPLQNKESRCYSKHLYLSGWDASPASFSLSCDKVLQFNLHLSTDGISSHISSPLVDIPLEDQLQSSNDTAVEQVEDMFGPQETNKSNRGYNPAKLHTTFDRKTTGNIVHRTLTHAHSEDQKTALIFNAEDTQDAEINNVVELSVAASEVLVIHELLQSGSSAEVLSAATILELALRVKQARLERMGNDCICSIEESDNIDGLSNIDDSDMEDAYEDVGLFANSSDYVFVNGSATSRVKDTPLSHSHVEQDRKVQTEEKTSQEIHTCDLAAKKQLQNNLVGDVLLKDFSAKIPDGKGVLCDAPALDSIFCMANHASAEAHQQGQSDHSAKPQALRSEEVDGVLQAGKTGLDKSTPEAAYRCQSHWLGGWTGKERDAFAGLRCERTKGIQRFLVGETSYLSESADVVPDKSSSIHNDNELCKASRSNMQLESLCRIAIGDTENAFMHNHNELCKASESTNLLLEGLCRTAIGEPLVFQDVAKDCSLSYVDPLCSVVPCSISTENGSSLAEIKDDRALDTRKNFTCELHYKVENSQTSSGKNVEILDGGDQDKPVINDVDSQPGIGMHLTSPRTYSTVLPSPRTCLEVENLNNDVAHLVGCNVGLLSTNHPFNCINSSIEKGLMQPQSVRSMSKCSAAEDKTEHCGAFIVGYTSRELTGKTEHLETNAEDSVKLQAHLNSNQRLPPIVHHRTRCRFLAPEPEHRVTCFSAENQKGNLAFFAKSHQSIILENHQFQGMKHTDTPIVARKRVHFAEVDFKLQRRRNAEKVHPAYEICSISKVGKMPEHFDQQQCTGSQEVKQRLTNSYVKDRKKRLVFQGLDFLLTGFSSKREREIEGLLRKYGGTVLSDIPSPRNLRGRRSSILDSHQLPVVLCKKKILDIVKSS